MNKIKNMKKNKQERKKEKKEKNTYISEKKYTY